MLLRAKRKQIKKSEAIRCWLDTANDPAEVSLDENMTRTQMHPADQFERFHELSRDKGWGAEEIGARFGVSPEIVKQRLRLGAVSPKLMDVYRQDRLTLDQLAAFAITDDHARQEQVFENLPWNRQPHIIRRDLTANNVPASDRRAVFIGADAYIEAGGDVIRDLFTEDHGGFFEDAGLLDMLVTEKLREIAGTVLAEGWKWAEASIDHPHGHGMRRYHPQPVMLSGEDEARLSEASEAHDALIEGYESYDDMPEDVAAKVEALSDEIDAISAKRSAYDPALIERGGVFVSLGSNGEAKIERGYVRAEDEPQPESEGEEGGEPEDGETADDEDADEEGEGDDANADVAKPISDTLIRDLTAHRTLGLRLALGEQTDMAMIALTHAMVLDLFYSRAGKSCLAITAASEDLAPHAEGIGDTGAGETLAARHDQWGAQLPDETADLWPFLAGLDVDSRTALLAHCVSLTVNAVKVPWERSAARIEAAEGLAEAVDLDMTTMWSATARSYFGRITKAQIAQAVGEAVSPEAAGRILPMKRADMADAAERLVAGTGWLPPVLRTAGPEEEAVETDAQPSEAQASEPQARDGVDAGEAVEVEAIEQSAEVEDDDQPHYAVAAE
jgi:ParB family chromosome partitioning protein